MKRRTILVPALLGAVLAYCSNPAAPSPAEVLFGLVSGDGQVATAGADSLLEPVVGQAYEGADGQVAFRFGAAPLAAQTTIGTGVPNVLTCATPVGPAGLKAYVQCATTDSQGFVRYWFEPGTLATDSACAEIRATPSDQPEVLATTCAVVKHGPMAYFHDARPDSVQQHVAAGDTVNVRALIVSAADQYDNAIDPAELMNAKVQWAWSDRVASGDKPGTPTGSGWAAVVPDPAALGYQVDYDGYYRPALTVWLDGVVMNGGPVAFKVLMPYISWRGKFELYDSVGLDGGGLLHQWHVDSTRACPAGSAVAAAYWAHGMTVTLVNTADAGVPAQAQQEVTTTHMACDGTKVNGDYHPAAVDGAWVATADSLWVDWAGGHTSATGLRAAATFTGAWVHDNPQAFIVGLTTAAGDTLGYYFKAVPE